MSVTSRRRRVEPLSLSHLIAPLRPATFAEQYWDTRPLVVERGSPRFYRSLLSLEDFDFLMSSLTSTEAGWLSIVKTLAQPLPRTAVTPAGFVDLSEVRALFGEGYTLLLTQLHQRHAAIGALCRSLERALGAHRLWLSRPIGANAYLTPPRSQGFSIHYDAHDVFVLQLHGRKRWRIYRRLNPAPVRAAESPFSTDQAGPLVREVDLAPGDLLYLPRGVLHEAQTTQATSLHVTLSLDPLKWSDLLHEAIAQEPLCHANVRVESGSTIGAGERARRQLLAEAIAGGAGIERALASIQSRLLQHSDVPSGPPIGAPRLRVGPRSTLRLASGMNASVEIVDGQAVLHLPGNSFSAPAIARRAFEQIAALRPFRVGQLRLNSSVANKIKLVEPLIRDGYLTRAPTARPVARRPVATGKAR